MKVPQSSPWLGTTPNRQKKWSHILHLGARFGISDTCRQGHGSADSLRASWWGSNALRRWNIQILTDLFQSGFADAGTVKIYCSSCSASSCPRRGVLFKQKRAQFGSLAQGFTFPGVLRLSSRLLCGPACTVRGVSKIAGCTAVQGHWPTAIAIHVRLYMNHTQKLSLSICTAECR